MVRSWHAWVCGQGVHGVRVPFSTPLPTVLLYHMKGFSARSEKFSLVMKITKFFSENFSFLGKKFSENFHKILLDKIRRVWYNEIFGRGTRPRPTQKVKYFLKKFFGTPGGVVLVFNATKLLFIFTKPLSQKKKPFRAFGYAFVKYAFLFTTVLTSELSSTNCFTIAETL